MKKTIKRVVSILLALAMIVTSIQYTPKTVAAATSLTDANNVTYTIADGNGTGNYVGFVFSGMNDAKDGFMFMWNGDTANASQTATINVKQGDTVVNTLGEKGNGVGITLSELSALDLSDGDYTLEFTGTGDFTSQVQTIEMNVATATTEEGGNTEEAKTSQNVTALATPKKAVLYDYRQAGGQYVIEFTDGDSDMTIVDGDSKEFAVYINNVHAATVTKSGDTIDASLINNLGLVEGTSYEVMVQEIVRRAGADTLTSAMSTNNYTFTYDPTPIEALSNDVPQIFVTTVRNSGTTNVDLFQTVSDKTKVDSTIVVKTSNGAAVECSDKGTIALRGNSTAGADKKPYNIKFKKAHDLFGLSGDGEGEKKWSLLANAFDKSLIRNQIGIQFHNYMETFQDHQYTSSCLPVDLYVDGKYLGSYLLIESVDEGKTRVNIDSENEDNNEILLELDSTLRDIGKDAHLGDLSTSTPVKTTKFQKAFTINEPGGPGNAMNPVDHDSQEAYEAERAEFAAAYQGKSNRVLAFLNAFEATLPENDTVASDIDEISKYIDLNSFVNYYITAELFKIKDVDYSSVRFYIKEVDGTDGGILEANDGKYYKLYAGPLWDLDLSCGNDDDAAGEGSAEQMKAQTNPWFAALMRNEDFQNLVSARYEEVLPKIKDIYADNGAIDTAATAIAKSADANYTVAYDDDNEADVNNTDAQTDPGYGSGWGYTSTDSNSGRATLGGVHGKSAYSEDYQDYVDDFKEWMSERNEYLMKQLGVSDKDATYTEYEDMIADKYYNLALDKDVTVYKNIHQEGKLEYLNDGLFTSGTAPLTNADAVDAWGTENSPAYFTIDLGAVYKASAIDEILIQYKDAAANDTVAGKPYQILYSVDGYEGSFYEALSVDSATLDTNNRTIDTFNVISTLSVGEVEDTDLVRYVQVYYPQQAGYGMQIVEAAVLDTDKDAVAVAEETVPAPTAVATVPADTYNTISVAITAAADAAEGTTYVIYLNGEEYKTVAEAGTVVLEDVVAGTYNVTVRAKSNGWSSEVVTAGTDLIVEKDPDAVDLVDQSHIEIPAEDSALWVPFDDANGADYYKSVYGTKFYISVGEEALNTVYSTNKGMSGLYSNGYANDYGLNTNAPAWQFWLPAGTPSLSYVCGFNGTGVVINGVRYTTDTADVTNNLVAIASTNDTLHIAQSLFQLEEGQTVGYFKVTIEGIDATKQNYVIKVVKETEDTPATVPDAPAGLVDASTEDTPNYFAWGPVEGATSYNVYIDGEKVGETVPTGYQITNADEVFKYNGTYKIGVTAVNEAGESTMTTIDYVVTDKEDAPVTEPPTVEQPSIEYPEMDSDEWIQLNGTSKYNTNAYVLQSTIDSMTAGELRGFYDAGTSIGYNISEAFKSIDMFAFVPTGNWSTSVIIDGKEYAKDDNANVWIGNDCVYINQELLKLPEGVSEKVFIITATDSSVGEDGTFALLIKESEEVVTGTPDLIVSKVEFQLADGTAATNLKPGDAIKMIVTVVNQGAAVTTDGSIVLHKSQYPNAGRPDDGYIDWAALTVPTTWETGVEVTHTFDYTVPADANTVAYTAGAKVDADSEIAESDENNNQLVVALPMAVAVANPTGVVATVNADKTATLTWTAPADDNVYTYNVYDANGNLVETTTTTSLTTDVLEDGTHTFTVKAVLDGNESTGVSTSAVVYDATDATWLTFSEATNGVNVNNIDANGNQWYVASNKLEYVDLFKDPAYLQIMNNGTQFITVIKEGGTGAAMNAIQTVTINGTTYTASNEADALVKNDGGDQLFMNVSLFPVPEDKAEEIYAISVTGTMNNATTTKSYLVKVVNPNYSTAKLVNTDGNISVSWTADDTAVNGYEITYTKDVRTKNDDGTETITSVTETVKVPEGTTAYSFTDNDIVLHNATKVIVKPIYGDDSVGEEIASATAYADLAITEVIPPEVIVIGENTPATVKYQNIGTASATFTAETDTWQAVMIRSTDGNNYAMETTVLNPGESFENEIIFNFVKTAGYNTLTALVDEGNRITESDENNNTKEFTVYTVEAGMADIAYIEETNDVRCTWKTVDNATGYYFVYTSNGEEITKVIDLTSSDITATEDGYYCTVENPIDAETRFKVYAVLEDGSNVIVGAETAYSDLIITDVTVDEGDKIQVGYYFDATVTVKNVGTGQIRAKVGDSTDVEDEEWQEGYANNTICVSVTWENADGNAEWNINDAYTDGLTVGNTINLRLTDIDPTVDGESLFTYWVDHYGYEGGGFVEFQNESNEDNNTKEITYNVAERQQIREMEWTRLTSAGFVGEPAVGEIYPFPVASGSQTAYIDYKVLDTTNTTVDFEDIISRYVGYQGANLTLEFASNFYNESGKNAINYVNGEGEPTKSETMLYFSQVPNWFETKDEDGKVIDPAVPGAKSALWTLLDNKSCLIETTKTDENGNNIVLGLNPNESPVTYAGQGINFFTGNFGLLKCYLLKFVTPVTDEKGNYVLDENGEIKYDYTVIALKVTDDESHRRAWFQAFASDASDPAGLPIPFCGGDTMNPGVSENVDDTSYFNPDTNEKYDFEQDDSIANGDKYDDFTDDTTKTDTPHEDTESELQIETKGALWYDATDILVSSISIYNGNWLSIATSEYMELATAEQNAGTQNWRLGIARATVDPEQNNLFVDHATDFVVIDPDNNNNHCNLQGTNTVLVGLPWLMQQLPVHSDLGGSKDQEYYYIRIWADYNNIVEQKTDEEGNITQLANYVDIPITVYYDVPMIEEIQGASAMYAFDEYENPSVNVLWSENDVQIANGYTYKIFVGDEQIGETYSEGHNLSFELTDELKAKIEAAGGKIKLVGYWCEQVTSVELKISDAKTMGWYDIDGENPIMIQGGQEQFTEVPGTMRFYYERTHNHSTIVSGYNGNFIALNGNIQYFNEYAKVYVANDPFWSEDNGRDPEEDVNKDETADGLGIAYNKLEETYFGEGKDYNEVETYVGSRIGCIQIIAKNLFTAGNKDSYYVAKVVSPKMIEVSTGEEGVYEWVPAVLTTDGEYVAAEIVKDAEGNVMYDESGNVSYEVPSDVVGELAYNEPVYIRFHSTVDTGNVAIRGFQMNTDYATGAVSEFSPSFRVVSRAARILFSEDTIKDANLAVNGTENPLVTAVVKQGTIYALASEVTNTANMTIEGYDAATGEYTLPDDVHVQEATEKYGILDNWTGAANDTDAGYHTYFAVTFKPKEYLLHLLTDEYTFRAYAVTETGDVIYDETVDETNPYNVENTKLYDIAEYLYQNSLMSNEINHNFLYNNVLNIVKIQENRTRIAGALLTYLGVNSKNDANYTYANTAYKDLFNYIWRKAPYNNGSYAERGEFTSLTDGNEAKLVGALNTADKTHDYDYYRSTAQWITENEAYIKTVNKITDENAIAGFYTKVTYSPKTEDADTSVDAGTQE